MNFFIHSFIYSCHMGSHSVTCHPAAVTFPPLPQPKLILYLSTMEGCKAEFSSVGVIFQYSLPGKYGHLSRKWPGSDMGGNWTCDLKSQVQYPKHCTTEPPCPWTLVVPEDKTAVLGPGLEGLVLGQCSIVNYQTVPNVKCHRFQTMLNSMEKLIQTETKSFFLNQKLVCQTSSNVKK